MTRVAFQTRVRNDLTILVLTVNSILWTAAVVAIAATDGGMVWFAAAFLASAVCSVGLGVWLGSAPVAPRSCAARAVSGVSSPASACRSGSPASS